VRYKHNISRMSKFARSIYLCLSVFKRLSKKFDKTLSEIRQWFVKMWAKLENARVGWVSMVRVYKKVNLSQKDCLLGCSTIVGNRDKYTDKYSLFFLKVFQLQ